MLTGRQVDADQAERIGLIHRLVDDGTAQAVALETARAIAGNAPLVNYLIVHALPRIADMSAADGLFTESLAASLSHASADAHAGMQDFLNRSRAAVTNEHPSEPAPPPRGNARDPV